MTLVVMAAGMGSRYGGLKQLDPVGSNGEFIIDFSIYDAVKSGFDKIVFVIKEENLTLFRDTVGKRVEGMVNVEYAFQSVSSIPAGFSVPDGRVKPWGTAHAVLSAKPYVNGPFAAINADDFYGAESFKIIADFLRNTDEKGKYCMAGYILKNTLTENGSVARGVCETDADGRLTGITEHTKIFRRADGIVVSLQPDGTELTLDENCIVSMNCWGFTGDFMDGLEAGFERFLAAGAADLTKCEYYLPTAVRESMDCAGATVTVLKTNARWYGVTYREDRDGVVEQLKKFKESGTYPDILWK